jgi:hypothetical protein
VHAVDKEFHGVAVRGERGHGYSLGPFVACGV